PEPRWVCLGSLRFPRFSRLLGRKRNGLHGYDGGFFFACGVELEVKAGLAELMTPRNRTQLFTVFVFTAFRSQAVAAPPPRRRRAQISGSRNMSFDWSGRECVTQPACLNQSTLSGTCGARG